MDLPAVTEPAGAPLADGSRPEPAPAAENEPLPCSTAPAVTPAAELPETRPEGAEESSGEESSEDGFAFEPRGEASTSWTSSDEESSSSWTSSDEDAAQHEPIDRESLPTWIAQRHGGGDRCGDDG
jgi:hypothetical protein